MLNGVGAAPLFRTIGTMEPSGLQKATDSKLPWSKVFDWMRTAPGERNLLAWARAVKSTLGVTFVGEVEWSIVTTPRQVLHPPR